MKRYYDKQRQEWIPVQYKIGTPGQDGKDGKDGVDGLTPEFRIIDGILYVSYDSWKTKEALGKVVGKDGTSINIKGTLNSVDELPIPPNNSSDCYIIGQDLYVWDGDSWVNVGAFKGVPGDTYYLHIKYGNSLPEDNNWSDWSANNGVTPSKYIGIMTSTSEIPSLNWKDYTWFKWKGEDGWGYEYIYCLTNTYISPNVPTATSNSSGKYATDDDFIPDGWFDNPPSVNETNPYCWMCSRKKINGVWTAFTGSPTEINKATLHSRWSFDGEQGQTGKSAITFTLYQRSADDLTHPDYYATSIFCTFKNNSYVLEDRVGRWTQNIPPDDGNPLWATTMTIFVESQALSEEPFELDDLWTIPAIILNAEKGIDGKMLYPAGLWNAETEYKVGLTTRPYVLANEKYYFLNTDRSQGKVPGESTDWTEMTQYSAIYAKVALIDYGKFGEAVFWKQFMFSTSGKKAETETEDIKNRIESSDYDLFGQKYSGQDGEKISKEPLSDSELKDLTQIRSKSIFIPNLLFDFSTGNGWFGAGAIRFNNNVVTAEGLVIDNDLVSEEDVSITNNIIDVNTFNVNLIGSGATISSTDGINVPISKYHLLRFTETFYNLPGSNKNTVNVTINNTTDVGQYLYVNPDIYNGLNNINNPWDGSVILSSPVTIIDEYPYTDNTITFVNKAVDCIYVAPQQSVCLQVTRKNDFITVNDIKSYEVTVKLTDTSNFYYKTVHGGHKCARQRKIYSLDRNNNIPSAAMKDGVNGSVLYILEDGSYRLSLEDADYTWDGDKIYISPDCDTCEILFDRHNADFTKIKLYSKVYNNYGSNSNIQIPIGNDNVEHIMLNFQRTTGSLFTTRNDYTLSEN